MKKRIFGMLLMGAMVVASMSMFTSCKDYDDDINANKAEIAALKTSLQEQKTSLEAAIAAAKSEAATANATLNTKLTELTTLVGNNKTELENAIKTAVTDSKAYADGVSAEALKAAKEYADAAAKEAAATAKAEALEEAKKLTDELAAKMAEGDEANAKALAEKADELVAKISAVDDKLVKLIDAEKEERINALAAVNTQIENIKLQIAALEKFKTEIGKKVSDIATDLDKTKAILESVKKAAEKNKEDIAANKEAITKNASDIAASKTALTVIDGKIAGLEEQVELLKKADVDLKALISANTAEIAAVKDAYQKADAALKQEFEDLLKKDYYTKAEIDEILKGYAKTTIDGYTVPADVEKYVSEVKADMENQITETLNAYDQKLAAALVALFGADDAEGAAAADVTMSDEAIEALKALKENYNNGINKQVEEQLNVLKVAQGKQQTSLVFIPDLYLDGIEAIDVVALKYTIYALADETKKGLVTELWGVKGAKKVAVPDSALTTWYYAATNRPLYAAHDWKIYAADGKAENVAKAAIFGDNKAGAVQYSALYPTAKAQYHMNPTTANIEDATLSFFTNVAKVEWNTPATRSASSAVVATPALENGKVTKAFISENVKDGILTVPFNVDRAALNAIRYRNAGTATSPIYTWGGDDMAHSAYSEEAFIALQATVSNEEGDTTVTSDYALLAPSDIEIVALEGTYMQTKETTHTIGDRHLSTKLIAKKGTNATFAGDDAMKADITSGFVLYEEGTEKVNGEDVVYYSPINAFQEGKAYTLKIKYNDEVDLTEFVRTHIRRGYMGNDNKFIAAANAYDEVMSDELMKDLGLHYEFEAIHYLSGSNRTDEYLHILLSGENGKMAKPTTVKADGSRSDEEAGPEVVGRMPIVRATLVDKKGNVLALGYILICIVDEDIESQEVEIELPEAWMNCTGPTKVTWAQIEDIVLKKVKLSKENFHKLYRLNTVSGVAIAQYSDATSAGLNSAYAPQNPQTATKGLAGRFYSKEQYVGDKYVDHYGDAILYDNLAATADPVPGQVRTFAEQYVSTDNGWVTLREWNDANASKKKYPLGSVYETINTGKQQTTVLEWNVGSEVLGQVFASGMAQYTNQPMETSISNAMMAATGTTKLDDAKAALAGNKGASTQDIKVTVAYSQRDKNDKPIEHGTIYITLILKAGNLHFAYAEVGGKDLSLWYQMNSWLNADGGTDADEIHLNVPTPGKTGFTKPQDIVGGYGWNWIKPAANGDMPLHGDLFYNEIATTFKQGLIKADGLDEDHFTKFKNTDFMYRFVDPETAGAQHITVAEQKLPGAENTEAPANKVKKSWIVEGVSGAKYLLYVKPNQTDGTRRYDAIYTAAWTNPVDGKAYAKEAEVARLVFVSDVTTTVPQRKTSIVYANNAYAQDILNYAGRLNKSGDVAKNDLQMVDGEYLTRENKAFTAFIEIISGNPCYQLLMNKSFFRARWLRPVNVVDGDKKWVDANNEVQTAYVADLVKVYDWRTYTVTAAQTSTNTNVHAPYYEISDSTYHHFYVDFDGIRTDHDLGAASAERKLDPNQVIEIENLTLAKDLPSLNSGNGFFKVVVDNNKLQLQYKNGGANVGVFHFYVPVYVCYAFGDYWMNTANEIRSIHKKRAQRTGSDEYLNEPAEVQYDQNPAVNIYDINDRSWATIQSEGWKPLFTQKVYAVITVDQTHQSHTGE